MQLTYRIYFLKDRSLSFMGYDFVAKRLGRAPLRTDYECIYEGTAEGNCGDDEDADKVYQILNMKHPADYRNRSLSMGDVVSFVGSGKAQNYFCDSFGWKLLPGFFTGVKFAHASAGFQNGRMFFRLKGVGFFPEDLMDPIDLGRNHLSLQHSISRVSYDASGISCKFAATEMYRSAKNIEAPHRWRLITEADARGLKEVCD